MSDIQYGVGVFASWETVNGSTLHEGFILICAEAYSNANLLAKSRKHRSNPLKTFPGKMVSASWPDIGVTWKSTQGGGEECVLFLGAHHLLVKEGSTHSPVQWRTNCAWAASPSLDTSSPSVRGASQREDISFTPTVLSGFVPHTVVWRSIHFRERASEKAWLVLNLILSARFKTRVGVNYAQHFQFHTASPCIAAFRTKKGS